MKKINCLPLNLDVISFVLFPQASEPSLNFNISKMAYCVTGTFWALFSFSIYYSKT